MVRPEQANNHHYLCGICHQTVNETMKVLQHLSMFLFLHVESKKFKNNRFTENIFFANHAGTAT